MIVLYHVLYELESNIGSVLDVEASSHLPHTTAMLNIEQRDFKTYAESSVPKSSVYRCEEKPLSALANSMKSQLGEDKFMLGRFNGLCGGSYMELGALDGVRYSNTHVFNKEFNWKGVLIEISPREFANLKKNRPNEIAVVNAAVCNRRQKLHFVQAPDNAVSGVYEFATEDYRNRWWKFLKDPKELPEIECLPMQDILDKHAPGVSFFDVLSLDVEGAEISVLNSIDFSITAFGMMVIEVRPSYAPDVRALLFKHGYIPFDGYEEHKMNSWFIHQNFYDIYAGI